MSPEQQRIAIALACGWKLTPYLNPWGNGKVGWYGPNGEKTDGTPGSLPDYLNSLDAMRAAEETLHANQCAEFARRLMRHHPTYCTSVLDQKGELEDVAYETFQLIHATAAQRAEAFLRTLNLWKE